MLAALLFAPTAFAVTVMLDQNGTSPLFWDGTSAVNCDVSASVTWTTDKTGVAAPTAGSVADNFQIGTNLSDFNGATITFNTLAATLTGTSFNVVATNCTVTWASTGNAHFNTANNIVTVATNSTLIWTSTANNNGFNFNNKATTFAGGGTMIFQDTFCANAQGAAMVMNMPGGTNQLNQTKTSDWGATVGANFTLTNGTLQFGSASALADTFQGFLAGDTFNINGGIIDNLSGAPGKIALGAGGYSIGGNFTFAGSSSLDLGAGAVTNKGNNTITVNANTLAIGGVIKGNTSGNSLTKLGVGTLLLYGASTYSGNTIVNAGTLALTNAGSIASSAQVAINNATFDISGLASGGTTVIAYSPTNSTLNVAVSSTSIINVSATTVNVGGPTNIVNFTSIPLVTSYPQVFTIVKGTTVNGTLNFGLGTVPASSPPFQGYITNVAATGSVQFVLTNGPTPVLALTWSGLNGGVPDGSWDVAITPDWLSGGSPSLYDQDDFVTFDDTAGGLTSVTLAGGLTPGSLVVSNNVLSYVFTGGNLSDSGTGPLSLNKQGSGTLLLQESGDNFTGSINANGGTLIIDNDSSGIQGGASIGASGTIQVGTNDTATANLPSGTITVNGNLEFNSQNNLVIANNIAGSGTVGVIASNVVQLSGANSGNWAANIQYGTLQTVNNTSLGSIPGGTVTVTNGGTLDVGGDGTQNDANFGTKKIDIAGAGVGGNGCIVNSGGFQQQNAFQNVVLGADATIGGANRWDIRGGTPLLDLAGHTLTKTNVNHIAFVSAHITSGNILIQQGTVSFELTPNFDASPGGTITAASGGIVAQYENTAGSFTRPIVLDGGTNQNLAGAGTTTILDAPILLGASSTLQAGGGAEYFNNAISDGGAGFGISQYGTGTNILAGTNTYSGPTIVGQGNFWLTNHGSIASSPMIVVTNGASFSVSGVAGPFSGTNFLVLGDDVNGAGTFLVGPAGVTNFNSITLNNAVLNLAVAKPSIPCITVTNLNLGDGLAGSTINVTTLPALVPAQFPLIVYGAATGTYNLSLGSMPAGFSGTLVDNTGNNSIDLQITATPPVWATAPTAPWTMIGATRPTGTAPLSLAMTR